MISKNLIGDSVQDPVLSAQVELFGAVPSVEQFRLIALKDDGSCAHGVRAEAEVCEGLPKGDGDRDDSDLFQLPSVDTTHHGLCHGVIRRPAKSGLCHSLLVSLAHTGGSYGLGRGAGNTARMDTESIATQSRRAA